MPTVATETSVSPGPGLGLRGSAYRENGREAPIAEVSAQESCSKRVKIPTAIQWRKRLKPDGNGRSLAWDDHYLIGSERIDSEHRIFFDLIVSYHDGRLGGMSKERLALMLEEIVLYARFHFKSEENMMLDIGYPGLAAHRNLHMQLLESLSNKLLGTDLGLYGDNEIEYFLRDWFVDHVTHEDTKVTAYLAGRGAASVPS